MASCSPPPAPRLHPTEQELDQLADRLRDAAQDHGHSAKTAAHYEAWLFLFLSWCLKVPPYDVHQNRLGDFWSVLMQRRVSQWKVSKAMEALHFFFAHLPDVSALEWAAPTPLSNADDLELGVPLPAGALSDGAEARAAVPTQSPSAEASESPDRDRTSSPRRSAAVSKRPARAPASTPQTR